MEPTSLADHYDLGLISLYLFWIFFAGLVYYLQREAQREGYPVEVDTRPGVFRAKSLMFYPDPKTFRLASGETVKAPNGKPDSRAIAAAPTARFPGAPLQPTGDNPMLDGVGPGAWAERANRPDVCFDGRLRIVPMRLAGTYHIASGDPDPRGAKVIGLDGMVGGRVVDVWVDLAEHVLRYYEVETGEGATARRVLLPANFANVQRSPLRIWVYAITGAQFRDVPRTGDPDIVTLREEDRIAGYYGAGTLYATPQRQEPLL